jgi:hypothetical protein
MRASLTALVVTAICGCGSGSGGDAGDTATAPALPSTAPGVGPTARHRPPSLSVRTKAGRPIGGLRCTKRNAGARYGVHLELFAARRVVLIPPGVGIAPPRGRTGAYVRGGRCSYPLRTREPTGVIEVHAAAGQTRTLGRFFAIWGQPLTRTAMAGFEGPVDAYVNGTPWRRDPRAIPLTRHAQIVLEVGGYVRPHAAYNFPPGL